MSNSTQRSTKRVPTEVSFASHYALKIALEAMKDRCQRLQNRLSNLEEENLQLRIEKHKLTEGNYHISSEELPSLKKKLTTVSRQNSLLSRYLFLVALENKEVWDKLNKLNQESKVSSDCGSPPNNSVNLIAKLGPLKGAHDDSLDEISLKVMNNITKGDPVGDLDQSTDIPDLSIHLGEYQYRVLDNESSSISYDVTHPPEIRNILDCSKQQKAFVLQQQDSLKNMLQLVKNAAKKRSEGYCVICSKSKPDPKSAIEKKQAETQSSIRHYVDRTTEMLPNPDDEMKRIFNKTENRLTSRICPMCNIFFPGSTPFDEFHDHVMSHFVEDAQDDSLQPNFEVVP